MNPYPGVVPEAPEPIWLQWFRVVGAVGLLFALACIVLMFFMPGARLWAIVGLVVFGASAWTAVVTDIVQEQRHKGRHH